MAEARAAGSEAPDGHLARHPGQIPPKGWLQIAIRTFKSMSGMETGLRCAGVAFFGFLSLFPAIAIVVALVGLFGDTRWLAEQSQRVSDFMPEIALAVLVDELEKLMEQPAAGLGISLIISLGVALWSGSRGMNALIFAASAAQRQREERSFLVTLVLSVVVTVLGAGFLLVSLGLVAAVPVIAGLSPIPGTAERLALLLRWPLLLVLAMVGISLLYRFTIDRRAPKLRWLWPGALLASTLWLGASLLFSIYVENFGAYETSFGSLAAAVVLLFWLYISAMIFVLGATFNAEIELQTGIDSTIGHDRPPGQRGAYVADHRADE